jgi:hypothetical protein
MKSSTSCAAAGKPSIEPAASGSSGKEAVTDEHDTQVPEVDLQKAWCSSRLHIEDDEEQLILWNGWIPSSDDVACLKKLTQSS